MRRRRLAGPEIPGLIHHDDVVDRRRDAWVDRLGGLHLRRRRRAVDRDVSLHDRGRLRLGLRHRLLQGSAVGGAELPCDAADQLLIEVAEGTAGADLIGSGRGGARSDRTRDVIVGQCVEVYPVGPRPVQVAVVLDRHEIGPDRRAEHLGSLVLELLDVHRREIGLAGDVGGAPPPHRGPTPGRPPCRASLRSPGLSRGILRQWLPGSPSDFSRVIGCGRIKSRQRRQRAFFTVDAARLRRRARLIARRFGRELRDVSGGARRRAASLSRAHRAAVHKRKLYHMIISA
jgi:hypothetical protein